MTGFNQLYVDVGPIGTNCHISFLVFLTYHLLRYCRITYLALVVNGGGRSASGYPVAGFVLHVPNGRSGACEWTCLSGPSGKVNYSSGQT